MRCRGHISRVLKAMAEWKRFTLVFLGNLVNMGLLVRISQIMAIMEVFKKLVQGGVPQTKFDCLGAFLNGPNGSANRKRSRNNDIESEWLW